MARAYANVWSQAASGLTAMAHTRAAVFRWGFVILLTIVWIGGGLYYWRNEGPLEAFYLTVSAVGMYDNYFNARDDLMLQVIRFSALAAPIVGLLFAFSGQLGRSLARLFNLGAAKHVVIAGDSPAALSLSLDCRNRYKDSVILIGQALGEDTTLDLRRKGVIVLLGDAANPETLKAARAHHAAHVVAFEPDDTANLQVEAAVRRLIGNGRRKPPISVHVATRSSMLLKESREMRSVKARKHGGKLADPIDPKPFSLDEMSARALLQKEAPTILHVADQLEQERVHIVMFGFDAAAESLASAILKSLWSVHFEAPRITVLAPNPEAAEGGFRARHRDAFAHPDLWVADIAFMRFDWDTASIGSEVLDMVEHRGKPTAAIVSTGADPGNIHLAIALKRAGNNGARWPIPIYMKESSESEFSKEYARGDDTPELDAYLQAFGAHQITATRTRILDGTLDAGAAIAHEHYSKNLSERDMSMRELQAAMRDWSDVLETYRAANRAVADSAMVKVWDAGWTPAAKGERGDTSPSIPPDLLDRMAKREHDRWMAERLMSGWRPSETRNNDLMAHDKLVPWEALNDDDRARDAVQVRAAIDIARVTHPHGFLPID
ncbi:other cation transporters [alpha proteobacterium U9-1i]|nr:other cation transporters [alpha proteobacterium U9-1i]